MNKLINAGMAIGGNVPIVVEIDSHIPENPIIVTGCLERNLKDTELYLNG